MRAPDAALVLCAAAMTGAFAAIARLGVVWDAAHAFVGWYLVACAAWAGAIVRVLRRPGRATGPADLALVVLVALLVRLLVLPHPIADDGLRYLWEARVMAAGGNPYALAPADPVLAPLAAGTPWAAHINHPTWTAIYPPPMLLLQAGVLGIVASPFALKTAFVAVEAVLVLLLLRLLRQRGLPPERVLVYAWCPLAVVATALEGHHDVVASCALVGALACAGPARRAGRRAATALLAVLAVATKGFALAALPALWDRVRARDLLLAGALAALSALPFLDAGPALFASLTRFADEMHTNDSIHALLRLAAAPAHARLMCAAIGLAVAAWVVRRGPDDPVARAAILLGTLFLLLPTAHPWYLVALLPLLVVVPWPGWLALSASVAAVWWSWPLMRADGAWVRWIESPRAKLVEYAPLALWLLAVGWRHARHARVPASQAAPGASPAPASAPALRPRP